MFGGILNEMTDTKNKINFLYAEIQRLQEELEKLKFFLVGAPPNIPLVRQDGAVMEEN